MHCSRWLAAAAAALIVVYAGAAETKKPLKAAGSIELTDPTGDVQPIHTSDNVDYPGFDIVKLSVKSDGKQIAVVATLKDPPGVFASDVVELYFDTDNNAKSGAKITYPDIGGFEYKGQLNACVDYADGSSACAGGSKAKPKAHWAAVNLSRYKGKSEYDKDTIVDRMGFPGTKASSKAPITGNVVQGSFDYQDLKVKSGQTIRLLLKEAHGNDADDGFFPPILLTLK
ncbi:MAG TPA: hypothetical protein VER58_07350 [Thermoanaerobaculia bacterium]|nr:hypothetical protein [Thermoanaerobaculia bacterium]